MRGALFLLLLALPAPTHAQLHSGQVPMQVQLHSGQVPMQVGVLSRALARPARGPVRWPRRPLLDVATGAVGAPAARARFSVTGAGATVCVIDTGIDLAHRDFRDRAGRTRVAWLLELGAEPRGGAPDLEARLGGAVWDAAAVDAALAAADPALPRDTHGHGTAVAAVAAGDDAEDAAPGPLAGVAPEAALVVVDAWREDAPGFADADVIAGLDFCLAAGDPARTVIVLGLGGHDGAHDGTEPLELAVESAVRRGAPVVVAAGNDGGAPVHAAGWLAADEIAEVHVEVPAPEPGERHVALAVETLAPGPVSVSVAAPDGTRTAAVLPGFVHMVDHSGGRVAIDGQRGERPGRSRVLYVVLAGGSDGAAPLAGGRYVLSIHGPGRFDAWLVDWDVGATLLRPRLGGPFVDPTRAVTIPATARSAIAVGATTPRVRVPTDRGELALDGALEGGVAPFSARGPSFRGEPKPDLVAPGGPLLTALSADLDPGDPHNLVGGSAARLASLRAGSDRVAVAGTSFAAPLVGGAVALALSLEPSRGTADRHLLLATARRVVDAAWSPESGAGVLDVEAFVAARARCAEGCAAAHPWTSSFLTTRSSVHPGARDLWLFARLAGRHGEPAYDGALTVRLPTGESLDVPVVAGIASAPLPPPGGRAGDVLVYEARAGDLALEPVRVRLHADDARDAWGIRARGGGCSASSASGRFAWLVPVLLVLVRRRRL